MRISAKYILAMLLFLASCSSNQSNEGTEAIADYANEYALAADEITEAMQDSIDRVKRDSMEIAAAMAMQDSLCRSIIYKFETFPDEPADMSVEQRADRYCEYYGLSYKDEALDGDMEWCAAIYYRDSLRRSSTEAYFDYLSKRMPDKYYMGTYLDESNLKQRAFGVYENEEFGCYFENTHHDYCRCTLPSSSAKQIFFTSIARVDSFYVVTCSVMPDCGSRFFVASMDKDFSLVNSMEFRLIGCVLVSDLEPLELAAYMDCEEIGDYLRYVDYEKEDNPEISVSEKGEVIVLRPTSYVEVNKYTGKARYFKTYKLEKYKFENGKFVLEYSVKTDCATH